jgi:uncharacterized protein YdcH (DUF465 family)
MGQDVFLSIVRRINMQLSQAVRDFLSQKDEEFRKVYEKHQHYEQELNALASKGFLSPEEELKVSEIKKLKLSAKDKMLLIAKKHQDEIKDLH